MPRIIGMPYSPSLVANAFIHRGQQAKRKFDHQQLQKLVFFAHAWSLTIDGESVVSERPEAWPHGPIFGSLYYRLNPFGRKSISMLTEIHLETGEFVPLIPHLSDKRLWFFVDQVFGRYAELTGPQLSAQARDGDGPWTEARRAKATHMQDRAIRDYFERKLPGDPEQRQRFIDAARARFT